MPYPKRDIKSVFEALRLRREHQEQDPKTRENGY